MQHGFLSSPLGLAELRLNEALPDPAAFETGDDVPSAGVALLAAAGLNNPASAPPDEPYTRFTAALLEVLRAGNERLPTQLSLSDLHQLVDRRIAQKFPDQARPELRSLQQTRGRVELVRLFRNPAAERLEAQHKAGEAGRLAEETRRADEAARLAEEKRRADEAARLAEETRRTDEDAGRLAEKQRKAEVAARQAEEQRKAEENRQEETWRKTDAAARLAEERRQSEEKRKVKHPPRPSGTDSSITEISGNL